MKNFQIAKKAPATIVETVNNMVATATNFTTLEEAEKTLARFTANGNANAYVIGSLFNAVKEKKLTDNVSAWAGKYGYSANTVYQLATIAKRFTFEDMEKWGMGKLIELKNPETLKLMESKGVTPETTAKEIRKAVNETKEPKKTSAPRKESLKTILKREHKFLENLQSAVAIENEEKWRVANLPSMDDETIKEMVELMDKLNIVVGNAIENVNENIRSIEEQEQKKREERKQKKLAKEKAKEQAHENKIAK